jgi:hypothetical protein
MSRREISIEQLHYAASLIVKAMDEGLYGEVKFKFENGILQRGWFTEVSLPPKVTKKTKISLDILKQAQ